MPESRDRDGLDMPLDRGPLKLRFFLGRGLPWLWRSEAHFLARLDFTFLPTLTVYS
jgi:hypothetical protein